MAPEGQDRIFLVGVDAEVRDGLGPVAEIHEVASLADLDASFAFDRIAAARPHVVLVGAAELGRGGLKLAELLKSDRRTRAIPLLLLFAQARQGSLSYYLNIGFDDFIILERDREALVSKILSQVGYRNRYEEFSATFEREFERLLGSFGIALVSIGADDVVRFATVELARLLDRTVESIEGQRIDVLAAPDQAQRIHEIVADLRHKGATNRSPRVKLRKPTGEDLHFGFTGMHVAEEDRVILCLIPAEREADFTRRARESQSLLRSLMRNASDGVFLFRDGHFVYANVAMREMFGYDRDEIGAIGLEDLLGKDSLRVVQTGLDDIAEGRRVQQNFDLRARRKDGAERWVNLSVAPLRHQGVPVVMGILRDVTDRRILEIELQRFADSLDHAGDLVVRVDPVGTVVYVNKAVEQYGVARDEALGRPFADLVGDKAACERFAATLTKPDPTAFESRLCPAGGDVVEAHVSTSPILDGDRVAGVVWIIRDVSALNEGRRELEAARAELLAKNAELESMREELEDRNHRLEELTKTDELTGIANARHFRERLHLEVSRAQRYGRPLSLLLIDLDKFKDLNDTAGHQRGDETLRTVAQLFRREMREADLIARYGGDEFVVLLPDTALGQAEVVADKLRADLVRQVERDSWEGVRISISVGVAALGEGEAQDAQGLVREADEAMYRAKARGGNCVECAPSTPAPGASSQGETGEGGPPNLQAAGGERGKGRTVQFS